MLTWNSGLRGGARASIALIPLALFLAFVLGALVFYPALFEAERLSQVRGFWFAGPLLVSLTGLVILASAPSYAVRKVQFHPAYVAACGVLAVAAVLFVSGFIDLDATSKPKSPYRLFLSSCAILLLLASDVIVWLRQKVKS